MRIICWISLFALSAGSLWIHDTMHGSMFAKRIEDVLRAKIPSTWPSSSAPDGKPLDPFDVLDLLDEEPGNAPIFGTIRRAVALRSEIRSATYSDRLSALLRKVLSAAEPRNRIEAAQNLLGEVVDPALLVQAVYGPASGDAEFPRSGSWRRQAVHMLGNLAKAGNRQAYDALKTFSASDEWIRSFGPYVFDKDVRSDADRQYSDPKIFRREFARDIWGNSSSV